MSLLEKNQAEGILLLRPFLFKPSSREGPLLCSVYSFKFNLIQKHLHRYTQKNILLNIQAPPSIQIDT